MKRRIFLLFVLQVVVFQAVSTSSWARETQDVGKLDQMLHERFGEHSLDLHYETDLAVISFTIGDAGITTNSSCFAPGKHTIKVIVKNNGPDASSPIVPEFYIDEVRVAVSPIPCIAPGDTGHTETKASFSEGSHSLRVIVRPPKYNSESHVQYKDPDMSNNGLRARVTFKEELRPRQLETVPTGREQPRPRQKK